jgi:hypothetical protein
MLTAGADKRDSGNYVIFDIPSGIWITSINYLVYENSLP